VDRKWVDAQLSGLEPKLALTALASSNVFEPDAGFYRLLESGLDDELSAASAGVASHLKLQPAPSVAYEWGIKMRPEHAGTITLRATTPGVVVIPMAYVGRPWALGAILAHELTHQFMFFAGLRLPDPVDDEPLTDLVSIAVGLGKLVLNGAIVEKGLGTYEATMLGYMPAELKAYAYVEVCRMRSVEPSVVRESLNESALGLLAQVDRTESGLKYPPATT